MAFTRVVVLNASILAIGLCQTIASAEKPSPVVVTIHETIPAKKSWDMKFDTPNETFSLSAMAMTDVPQKYDGGLRKDRSNPFLLRSVGRWTLPAGEYNLLLRSRGAARLLLDGKVIAETNFLNANASGHEHVPNHKPLGRSDVRPLPPGDQQQLVKLDLDGKAHRFSLLAIVGGKQLRPEVGQLLVADPSIYWGRVRLA